MYAVRNFLGIHEGATLYRTLTYCPTCVLVKRRMPVLLPAAVVVESGAVRLRAQCDAHTRERTRRTRAAATATDRARGALSCVLCSDVRTFMEWNEATIGISSKLAACSAPDTLAAAAQTYQPFIKLIPLFKAGAKIRCCLCMRVGCVSGWSVALPA